MQHVLVLEILLKLLDLVRKLRKHVESISKTFQKCANNVIYCLISIFSKQFHNKTRTYVQITSTENTQESIKQSQIETVNPSQEHLNE